MNVEELRDDIAIKQKKGLPFIMASVVLWTLIAIVAGLDLAIDFKNILVFSCSAPLLPLAWLAGKKPGVDIFAKDNPLGDLGFLFTMNQVLYILIVMWVFNAVPEKMIMVYAMVFGAHLLPYSWLYKSRSYKLYAIVLPILALVLGNLFSGFAVALAMAIGQVIFAFLLFLELRQVS